MPAQRDEKKRRRREESRYRKLALVHATKTLLKRDVKSVEYPGGKNRESLRLILADGQSVIATRRDSVEKARRESTILTSLSQHTAAVPQLLASNHSQILLQEELLGERLSRKMVTANNLEYRALMDATLRSLNEIHQVAEKEELTDTVEPIGHQKSWLRKFLERPKAIGRHLDVTTPVLDIQGLSEQLAIRDHAFIKWDTRPGNALVTKTGDVTWFDWEHASMRNRLDDMAWIMTDEYIPDRPVEEVELLNRHLHSFSPNMHAQEAHDYLMTYGTFHMLVRLGLILKFKNDQWWDLDMCIENDKIGVTLECAEAICRRGARWSKQSRLAKPLSGWFDDIRRRIRDS